MDKLRIGIIGLGVGEKHIEGYQKHPNCEVVALCDFSEEKLRKVREEYPRIYTTKSADEIIDNDDIDIVSIASFDNYHFEQAAKSLQKNKHIFVEKPLCLFREEAEEIKKILDKKPDLKISLNLNLRTSPLFKWLKKSINSGELGQIFYIEGDYLWGRVNKLTDGWRKEMHFYSIIHGAAVHMVDLLIWLTGMVPVEVEGYGNQISTHGSDLHYNDFAVFVLKFDNGMVAKISASGGCVHPHFHKVEVWGTKQTFVHDINGTSLITSCDFRQKPLEIHKDYPGKQKGEIIYSFIDSILSNVSQALVPPEDVFKTMSVCFAAEEAIKKGRPVTIKYI